MKIALVGKGGSGKTTVAALLSNYLAASRAPVLAIDADINQNLGRALGMSARDSGAVPPLGQDMTRLKTYLRGTNPRIASLEHMVKTTPPGAGSRLLRVAEDNELYEHFSRMAHGVRFMAVGDIETDDIGAKCYHAKTGAVELLLNHMCDGAGEYVVIDMTAGADAFSSGLFTRFDITFVVVEPTEKSVLVYEQYKRHAAGFGIVMRVVGNKIETEDDEAYIRKAAGDDYACSFPASGLIKKIDRGEAVPWQALEQAFRTALAAMRSETDGVTPDRAAWYRHAVEFHLKNAERWANAAVGADVRLQIDPDFRFPRA
jgi:CO dehydrogenase maturation factor